MRDLRFMEEPMKLVAFVRMFLNSDAPAILLTIMLAAALAFTILNPEYSLA